jgi:hypothetical protein
MISFNESPQIVKDAEAIARSISSYYDLQKKIARTTGFIQEEYKERLVSTYKHIRPSIVRWRETYSQQISSSSDWMNYCNIYRPAIQRWIQEQATKVGA